MSADTRETMTKLYALIEADNLAIRERFMREVATRTAADVAIRVVGSARQNPDIARQWREQKRVIAVPFEGEYRYPAFQFTLDGQPKPVISRVLAVLPNTMSAWAEAFWFVSSNSWLGGPAPRDHMDEATALIEAARHESDECGG